MDNKISSSDNQVIYLAGGCFWGVDHFMKMINGVINTQVGYANSNTNSPSYKEVCSGATNAVETVKVEFDNNLVSLKDILELFFKIIDPTSLNKQGGDRGTQYRTGIYYEKDISEDTIKDIKYIINKIQKNYSLPIVTEVGEIINFYPAEEYHQDYLERNPSGYCHVPQELFMLAKNFKKK